MRNLNHKNKKGQALIEATIGSMILIFMFMLMAKIFYVMNNELNIKIKKSTYYLSEAEKIYEKILKEDCQDKDKHKKNHKSKKR